MRHRNQLILRLIFLILGACSSCDVSSPSDLVTNETATVLPTQSLPVPTHTLEAYISPTPSPLSVWIDPIIPSVFQDTFVPPPGWEITSNYNEAAIRVAVGSGEPFSSWIYVLAAPFFTITDSISSSQLQDIWKGAPGAVNQEMPSEVYLDQSTYDVFSELWGTTVSEIIQVVDPNQVNAQTGNPGSPWAVIRFEDLNPGWKVIAIDGNSPIHSDFSPEVYPLKVDISIQGEHSQILTFRSEARYFSTNRQPDKMTTVVLTGVTALVRATAAMMEYNGMTYPALDIAPWLREADITHINNEVPFARNCPTPTGSQPDLKFCSKPEYIELLEYIGTDIVELSGDHLQDWGNDAILFTVDLYEDRGWHTYGGGKDINQARQPVKIEHNGNKIAFLGCSAKELFYARASEDQPGAYHCDHEWMHNQIRQLVNDGYLPIVTLQHVETFTYAANKEQQNDFRAMADAGAIIVSGSQAHQPQAMEIYRSSFIHYGLGNLFFDQYYEGIPMRQSFIDRHTFYGGRHISTELLTAIFIDLARIRPMTQEERNDLLSTVFNESKLPTQ